MNLYAFELGRKKDLCFAELLAVLGKQALIERNLDSAIFKLPDQNWQKLQNSLGGTIKIIRIFDQISDSENKHKEIESAIKKHLNSAFKDHTKGKILFSISLLSFKNQRDIHIKQLLNFSKIFLKSLSLGSRFVNKGPFSPKSSTIFKARVLEKGIDVNIIKGRSSIFFGETVAIQDIAAYGKRDYEKPCRDPRVGMLPPKLAQIMINLAKPRNQELSRIYDPFCGTGSILMEGLLYGLDVIGSDLDPRMVEYSQKNCEWLEKIFHTNASFRIFERDARFINKKILPEKVTTIVTEGYLGEPASALPNPEKREQIFRELGNLHLNWLNAVAPFARRIVMCTTAFLTKKGIEHFPRFEEIAKKTGYKIMETFTYDRPDQIVVRDVRILEKLD